MFMMHMSSGRNNFAKKNPAKQDSDEQCNKSADAAKAEQATTASDDKSKSAASEQQKTSGEQQLPKQQ